MGIRFEFRTACADLKLQTVEWFAENGRGDLTKAAIRAAFKAEFVLTDELQ